MKTNVSKAEQQEKIDRARIRRAKRADRPGASAYARVNVHGGMRKGGHP